MADITYTMSLPDFEAASPALQAVRRVRSADVLFDGLTVRRRIRVNPFQAGQASEGLTIPPLPVGLQLPR